MSLLYVGAAVAIGGTVYGISEQEKAKKAAAGNARSMGEVGSILNTAPDYLAAGREGDWLAGMQQQQMQGDYLDMVLERYPEIARREREATSMQRAQDATDLGHSGRRMQGIIENMAPELRTAGDAMSRVLEGVGSNSPLLAKLNTDAMGESISPINTELQRMALAELGLGGSLSADESRQVRQDSRAAYSARGTLGGDVSNVDEILNLEGARRARLRERMGMAAGVNRDWLSELMQDRAFAGNVEELNQRRRATDASLVGTATEVGNARLRPMLGIFNQRSGVTPMGASSIFAGAPNPTGTSARSLADIMGYGSDVFDTNFNAVESRANAQANAGAAIAAGSMQAGTSMASTGYKYRG